MGGREGGREGKCREMVGEWIRQILLIGAESKSQVEAGQMSLTTAATKSRSSLPPSLPPSLLSHRTGPATLRCLLWSRARFLRSSHTFSKFLTFREVRVMRMRWI